MSYVSLTLAPREVILARGRFHWTYSFISWAWLLLAGWLLIGVAVFFSRQMRKWTTELVVTNRRFIYKRGFISRRTDEFNAARIHAITLEQSLLGRLLGYGTLNVRGVDIGDFGLPAIAKPIEFRKALIESLDVSIEEPLLLTEEDRLVPVAAA
ncbi:PH domain-containing protein [Candidatus Phaeomarinobacter ectocarpi]|uniref:PH domain-containing protein n=1 Tax=Candidatus Phaeomarinibacter ectocarpi TaxID=1458461 RepID=UPI000698D138|nr:PH domain-containing protein [Candidatus Phaeomarinobacter ectocarpi]